MRHAAMEQFQALPHNRITRPGEPPRLLLRQAGYITAQSIDEQGFRELGEHGVTADARRSCFFHQMQNRTFQPLPGSIGADMNLEDRRQATEYGTTEIGVAGHVSADEA